jgi:5'-nucleotidase
MNLHSASIARARRALALAFAALLAIPALAENITILHVGDQESWLLSAQGNLRDTPASGVTTSSNSAFQIISYYGGVDRLATVINDAQTAAETAGRFVLKLNAGDSLLPGPRLTASFVNLGTAYNGGQDFYDTIALRALDFDATVFGNHEFDLGVATAARFVDVSETNYLSINLDFTQDAALNTLLDDGKIGASKIITTPGGKKIGLIGVTTPLLPFISSPQTLALMDGYAGFSQSNTEQQNLAALLPVIQAEIDALRTEDAVDVVIVLSHLQNANNERTILVPGLRHVDLVVSGGGHELMTDPDDQLINGGVAPTFTTHPITASDLDSQPVPIVTGHFGNRYVGELNATIGDTPGEFSITSTRMIRVSGRTTNLINGSGPANAFAAETDAVVGDPALFTDVVTPVLSYISALNAQVIGTTTVRLNADRGSAGTPRNYAPGIRKSETNLGNLVADAMRFAGEADVAIQNGGGVRTSIAGPGNVTEGDTFNVLPFTNLVKRAPVMNAIQLKAILEHGFGGTNTNPSGGEEGRYPQVSGIQVIYDSTRPGGSRVRRLTLTNNTATTADDTLLVDYGTVVNSTATFSFATIDFTAAGGDGYPFAASNVIFENSPFTITYQAALSEYIRTSTELGGLGGVIDSTARPEYAEQNIFDRQGRIIDMIYAGRLNDIIVGTAGADFIQGGSGSDTITTGAGADTIIYTSLRDGIDRVTDFTTGSDKIDLSAIFAAAGITPILGTDVFFTPITNGVTVQVMINGRRTPIANVIGVTAVDLNNPANFIL